MKDRSEVIDREHADAAAAPRPAKALRPMSKRLRRSVGVYLIVLSLTFSSRAGHETLERGYLWWYLTRPISSAGLGLLFYLAIIAGFFDASGASDRQALGLFTDQVLKKMRGILGLLPTHRSASDKDDDLTDDAKDDPTTDLLDDARVEPKPGPQANPTL